MVGELDPYTMTCAALNIVKTGIRIARILGGGHATLDPFKGKNGELVEMYAAMMILEHVATYLLEVR